LAYYKTGVVLSRDNTCNSSQQYSLCNSQQQYGRKPNRNCSQQYGILFSVPCASIYFARMLLSL